MSSVIFARVRYFLCVTDMLARSMSSFCCLLATAKSLGLGKMIAILYLRFYYSEQKITIKERRVEKADELFSTLLFSLTDSSSTWHYTKKMSCSKVTRSTLIKRAGSKMPKRGPCTTLFKIQIQRMFLSIRMRHRDR